MTAIVSLGPGPKDLARQILEHQAPQYTFAFTPFLMQTYRHGLSPNRPVCKAYFQGHCPLGTACPDKHTNSNTYYNNVVCKHWLRGLCKKGDTCEFLHEYNIRSMPECDFYVREGFCKQKDDCCYLHISPHTKAANIPCPHYEKGFCPLGSRCAQKHMRKQICEFYLAGFCPDGPGCKKAHPRWPKELAKPQVKAERSKEEVEAEEERLRGEWEERERERDARYGSLDGGRGGRWRGRGRGGGGGGERRGRGRGHY